MIVDALAFLGRHPFTGAGADSCSELAAQLSEIGVERAYVLGLEALFQRDVWRANWEHLSRLKGGSVELLPLAGVNPDYALSRKRLEELAEAGFKGLAISPSYHGFPLTSPRAKRLLNYAADVGLPAILVDLVEDERGLHRAYRLRYRPSARAVEKFLDAAAQAGARVMLHGFSFDVLKSLAPLARKGEVYADVSHNTVYGPIYDRLAELVELYGGDRVVLCTGAPLRYPLIPLFKVLYSSVSDDVKRMILRENALRLYSG